MVGHKVGDLVLYTYQTLDLQVHNELGMVGRTIKIIPDDPPFYFVEWFNGRDRLQEYYGEEEIHNLKAALALYLMNGERNNDES